jgi:hypothetical protein
MPKFTSYRPNWVKDFEKRRSNEDPDSEQKQHALAQERTR